MALPEHGRSKDELLAELEAMRAHDVDWRSGRCFSYVFSAGDDVRDVARAATTMYLSENALNTAAFPSLGRLQAEVVDAVSGFAHGGPDAAGLHDLRRHREHPVRRQGRAREGRARARHHRSPRWCSPESAHAAFHKGAHYFGVRAITVPVRRRLPRRRRRHGRGRDRPHRARRRLRAAVPPGCDRPDPGARRARRGRGRQLPHRRVHGRDGAAVPRAARRPGRRPGTSASTG